VTVVLKRRDGKILSALWQADHQTGLTTHALMQTAELYGGWFQASIDRLFEAKLIESRWHGEPWPGSRAQLNEAPAKPGATRPRYYRLTASGRERIEDARQQA